MTAKALATARQTAAGALQLAAMPVKDHMPGRLNPPIAVIGADSPYVTSGSSPFGSFTVRLRATLVAGSSPNDVQATTLDDMIQDALVALVNAGYSVGDVSQPFLLEANGGAWPAVDLSFSTDLDLT